MMSSLSPRSQARLQHYEQADSMLLQLGKLRQRCVDYLKKEVGKLSSQPYDDHLQLGSPVFRFAWQLVSTYRSTLPAIARDVSGCTPKILYRELFNTRRAHLVSFICSQLSRRWDIVEDDDKSWRTFANNIPFDDPQRSQEVSDFFRLLDTITITTDIMQGQGEAYGIDMEIIVPENLETEEIPERNFAPVSTEGKISLSETAERNFAPASTADELKSSPVTHGASYQEQEKYQLALSVCLNAKIAQKVIDLLESAMSGKQAPIDIMRPVRAAMQAGVLSSKMSWKEFCRLFGEHKVSRSSYNEYTTKDNQTYKGDKMYDLLYFDFKNLLKPAK